MKQYQKIILYLMLILTAYAVLHIYHPNPENTTTNWVENKEMFYDDNNRMYFLSYDSYYYVNNANMLVDGRVNWQGVDFDFQTAFLYLDKVMFKEYFLSYYLSFFIGFIILVLLFYVCYVFTESPESAFFATALFAVNDFFFAITTFNYVDNTVVNVLLFMILFTVMISELKYWQKWVVGILVYWALVLNWNGAFLFDFILVLFLGLYIYYTKLDIHKYKKEIIIAFCTVIFFCIMFYFSRYFDIILTYFSFETAGIVELQRTTLNLFYLFLFIAPFLFIAGNIFKEKLDIKKIVLIAFLVILTASGLWYLRLFYYCLPFIFVTVALLFAEIDKWYYKVLLFIVIISLYYFIIPFSTYDGGMYGVPFVDDSVVNTGLWIKANTPEDAMIISNWDYCIFYETYAERTCKYKHSPVGINAFYSWLYNTNEQSAVANMNDALTKNSIIVVDAHWSYSGFRDALKGKRARYPDEETLYYRLLNNRNLANLTLLHAEYGGRLDYYYVYGVK